MLSPLPLAALSLASLLFSGTAVSQNVTTRKILNPILPGAHPDPSCIHVPEEETFFCASSSFNIFPGIPIHASRDLTTWKLVGHVLNRPTQLPALAQSVGSTSGIWAPTLRRHNGTYYLVTTMVHDKRPDADPDRWDNIIFKTRDIWNESSWSDAIHFKFQGYDTSPYWAEDGTEYVVGAHAWKVGPAIMMAKVDLSTGKLNSDWQVIWNGTGGLAPEGPHIYDKDGWHYLLAAEGGTGKDHMVTMARSKNLAGPYESNPANPVLTNANTTQWFQAVGHADLLQDSRGYWWCVALSVRSGPKNLNWPMGRETVLTNVTWTNGSWPVFQPVRGEIQAPLPPEVHQDKIPGEGPTVDEVDAELDFKPGSKIPSHFVYWRPPIEDAYTVSPPEAPNSLRLRPSKLNLTGLDGNSPGPGGITFIARRQTQSLFNFKINVDFNPTIAEEEAGVALFLSQNHHARLGLALLPTNTTANTTGPLSLHLRFRAESYIPVPAPSTRPVPTSWLNKTITLEVRTLNLTHYTFAAGPADTYPAGRIDDIARVPAEIISWGFTGALVGAYATGNGGEGKTAAYVRLWDYVDEAQIRDVPVGWLEGGWKRGKREVGVEGKRRRGEKWWSRWEGV